MTSTNTMPVYEAEQGYADTWGVGGDRFAFYPSSMFNPQPFIGETTPASMALLSIPPTYNQLGAANAQYGAGSLAGQIGSSDPWNPKASLVPWVIVALVIGWFGIHHLYYKKGKKD